MTTFQIHQIQLTSAQIEAVNNNETVPGFEARNKMNMDFTGNSIGGLASDAFDSGLYTHVANITARDYNECFEVGNIGPESSIERLARMSSLSVGDVIVSEDGTVAVVAPMGFVSFAHRPN